ncbi:MAG: amidohydrolase family protein [Mycoplasmataceae bacterium]|jgi:predicted amidohydrolase YtcJ|nr:amidohydrolase family protein [Mycoplasmataceae bacterium]
MLLLKKCLYKKDIVNILIDKNKIKKISKDKIKVSKNAEIINVNKKRVLPGMIDTHMHSFLSIFSAMNANLSFAKKLDDINDTIVNFISQKKLSNNIPVMCSGFFEANLEEAKNNAGFILNKEFLDNKFPSNPICVARICQHIYIFNTAFINLLKAKIDPKRNIEDLFYDFENGIGSEETGLLAMTIVVNFISKEELKKSFIDFFDHCASLGLTSIQSNDLGFYDKDIIDIDNILKELDKENKLPLRIFDQIKIDEHTDFIELKKFISSNPNGKLYKYSTLKAFADGSLGGKTAALTFPYSDDKLKTGILIHDFEIMKSLYTHSNELNMPLAVHAIGDKAILECCRAYECSEKKNKINNTIVHCILTSEKVKRQLLKQKMFVSIQPAFMMDDYKFAYSRLGEDRIKFAYQINSLLEQSIPTGAGSDAPITDINPFVGIYCAVNTEKFGFNQSVGYKDAINLYTKYAAKLLYTKKIGKIKEGHFADIIVLEKDVFKNNNKDEILDAKVSLTIVNGKIVYKYTNG